MRREPLPADPAQNHMLPHELLPNRLKKREEAGEIGGAISPGRGVKTDGMKPTPPAPPPALPRRLPEMF